MISKRYNAQMGEYLAKLAEKQNTAVGYVPQLKKTNADRIRAMTDEEMAEFIAYSTSCETCVVRKSGSDECHNTNCSTAWLEWLKEEVHETL